MLSGLQLIHFMFDVPLPDTYGMYQYVSDSSYSSLLWLVVITLLLMVTVVTVSAAFLYWRCCCFLISDFLFVKALFKSMQLRAENFYFGNVRRGGGACLRLFVICV
jgi:hypothetical protein